MANAEIIAPAIAAQLGLPSYFLDHLVYAKTSAYTNLPIAATGAPFPVILFSHGYGGFRAQNTSQAQDLASHGFVVAAVEHPYASAITVFPDGRLALKNPDTLPEGLGDAAYEAAAERLVAQWTADLIFALDTLAAMNAEPGSPFAGRLDLARVGVMGHSTGGGAAVQFCAQEPRCAAGLGMDAWLLPVTGDVMAGGLDQPFLYMFSEEWSAGPNPARFADLSAASAGAVVTFTIEGSAHYDFTDLPALSPLAANLGLKGPIDAGRVMSLVTGYTVAFFDIHLRGGDPAQLSALAQAYPEAAYP
jgi:predicted dienelactone hydrolase